MDKIRFFYFTVGLVAFYVLYVNTSRPRYVSENIKKADAVKQRPPCLPPSKVKLNQSIFYIRGPKTASTTTSGVFRRIAKLYGLEGYSEERLDELLKLPEPKLVAVHLHETKEVGEIKSSFKNDVVTIANVRHPADRCLSHFYHMVVTRGGVKPTDDNIINFMKSECKNVLYNYYDQPNKHVDLFLITERLNESLIMLKIKYGFTMGDMLYFSIKRSKDKSQRDYGAGKRQFVPSVLHRNQTEKVKEYLEKEFVNNNALSYNMYMEANFELDKFIREYGYQLFYHQVGELTWRVRKIKQLCENEVFDVNGYYKEDACLVADMGCAFKCMNNYVNEICI